MSFKLGDVVKITGKRKDADYCKEFLSDIGKLGKIDLVGSFGTSYIIKPINDLTVFSNICNEWSVLGDDIELFESESVFINNPFVEKTEWNVRCSKCNSPAYRGFIKIECSNKNCK